MLMKNNVIDNLFNPESIALVGVSSDTGKPSAAQWFLKSLINFGYKGRVYGVHPAGARYTACGFIPVLKRSPVRWTTWFQRYRPGLPPG